ncbi:protein FAR1-RELATED SEQUENCE 3-like [Impatiens glandulifera]|uniref:protein FAR1-RELATED SEQUENCE 3-like n=1 Tax=Impatiens glandulifera TaxID=253017 RepID=UPI001FB126AD|nr:protein FAR1-RELATED SEQUENCE 3-like [Impatiens glandulifera]
MESGSTSCRRLNFEANEECQDDGVKVINEGLNNKNDLENIEAPISEDFLPSIGQEIESEEVAYQFYLTYARRIGFSIKKSRCHINKSGKMFDRVLCYSAHGKKEIDKCHDLYVKNKRAETAIQIEMASEVGIPQKHLMIIWLDKWNKKRGGWGFKRCIGIFEKQQLQDPNFFYVIQLDEDDLITNIYWFDAKMRADYSHFGDVICFDTTYRKNNEGRPIALFVGVNHHKQSIIFGVSLLYDEISISFEWLFDTFSKAMREKKSTTILTDQDAAMTKALTLR